MFELAYDQNTDNRIIKTKNALFIAFTDLLETDGFHKINISSLTRAAKVNRKTFYLHYASIEEMLEDMANLFITQIVNELTLARPFESEKNLFIFDIEYSTKQKSYLEWLRVFQYINNDLLSNEKQYSTILKAIPIETLTNCFSNALIKKSINEELLQSDDSIKITQLYIPAMSAAIITLYQGWIKSDGDIPISEIANIAANIVARTLTGIATSYSELAFLNS